MKKNKLIALILMITTVMTMFSTVFANDEELINTPMLISADAPILIAPNPNAAKNNDSIKVQLNDGLIDFTDEKGEVVEPQIINGRTMVPMRKIFEVFGAEVGWNGETKTITATTPEKVLTLQIGSDKASIATSGDVEEITLDSVPVVKGGRTLVPVRFIAESLDLRVGWVSEEKTVVILDTAFIWETLEREVPTFYEYITQEYVMPETYETDLKITGNVNYTDEANKKNNTSLKINLSGKAKKAEDKLGVDLTFKSSGKGSLLETLKENGLDSATLKMAMDLKEMKMYMKSTLLESEIGKKWAAIDFASQLEETEAMLGMLSGENLNVEEAIEMLLDNVELTTSTYYDIDAILDIICLFASDEYFTVSGRTAKTYTYEISFGDILDILGVIGDETEKKEILDTLNFTIKMNEKVKDE